MITIELKDQTEAQVLCNLINVAIQAKGLEAAESGLYFYNLIVKSIEESKKVESEKV